MYNHRRASNDPLARKGSSPPTEFPCSNAAPSTSLNKLDEKRITPDIPIRRGHPHYPCLLIESIDCAKLLQCIYEAITTDSWSLCTCERQKCHLDARIFYYGLPLDVTFSVFQCKHDKRYANKMLLQMYPKDRQSYGPPFYELWQWVVLCAKGHGFKAKEFYFDDVPENPTDAPTLSCARSEIDPLMQQQSSGEIPSEKLVPAPAGGPTEEPDASVYAEALKSKFEDERIIALEDVGLAIKDFVANDDVMGALWSCAGAENEYGGSRVRALAVLSDAVRHGHSPSQKQVSEISKGAKDLSEQIEKSGDTLPGLKRLASDYVAMATQLVKRVPEHAVEERNITELKNLEGKLSA